MKRLLFFVGITGLATVASILSGAATTPPPSDKCIVRKAAFDIGSGTTKVALADVDECHHKIVKILYENHDKVEHANDLAKRNAKAFSDEIMNTGVNVLQSFKKKVMKFDPPPKEFAGVATAAFRIASNTKAYLGRINKDLGIRVRVIPHTEEANLGFVSAVETAGVEPKDQKNVIVWDIGDGSMQITHYNGKTYSGYLGTVAAVGFRNKVISEIQKKDPTTTPTPNPLIHDGKDDAAPAVALAEKVAKNPSTGVPANIRKKLKNTGVRVMGIGGVLRGVTDQADADKNSILTADELKTALNTRGKLGDKDIDSKYATTDITNIALILGFMQGLGIHQIEVLKINLTPGVLVTSKYWR